MGITLPVKLCLVLLATLVGTVADQHSSPNFRATTATPAEPPLAGRAEIEIRSNANRPSAVEVAVGTTLTWISRDGHAHTVTDLGGAFDSSPLYEGAAFAYTFSEAGRFTYICDYHHQMLGSVMVTE
ncbi:MAG: amidase [Chloroflexota bacterium]|nr:amidase [Chloroflexota bacterium]